MTLARLLLVIAAVLVLVSASLATKALADSPATPREQRTLRCVRQVESRGTWHAVSRSGRYRNAYQMDSRFWRSYSRGSERHWTGRHEMAPPDVQTRVALRGLRARGLSPWPPARRRCR